METEWIVEPSQAHGTLLTGSFRKIGSECGGCLARNRRYSGSGMSSGLMDSRVSQMPSAHL